ncbi:MAG: hypothetical protein JWP00_1639 [Chloroflexi bacterium]|nr:hypothetical protein [Chloroflexota bacterium]
MSDQTNFNLDPNFRQSLNAEQLLTLEKVERLAELDPEVTRRLARALDRLQQTLPYQQLDQSPGRPENLIQQLVLSEAERAAHEEFVSQELLSLLGVANQLVQAFGTTRPQAQADRRFREQLRAQFK